MAKSYIDSVLGEHEKIILMTRRHWFSLAASISIEIVLILVIIIATGFAAETSAYPLPFFVVAVGLFILLLPVLTMIRDILNWSNHQYIVTNRRVLQISGVLNKNITDSSLDKVNDVKMEQSAFGRIFDYGNIEILTASELGVNLFKRIENPIRFKTAMLNAKEQLDHGDSAGMRSTDIPRLIAGLDHLRELGILTEDEFQSKKTELLKRI